MGKSLILNWLVQDGYFLALDKVFADESGFAISARFAIIGRKLPDAAATGASLRFFAFTSFRVRITMVYSYTEIL